MTLSATLRKAVAVAFKAVGDLRVPLTYVREGGGAYDPTLGTAPSGSSSSVNGVVVGYAQRQIDGTVVQLGDKKVLLEATELAVPPTVGGAIVQGGVTYQVVGISSDPSDSLYVLQVRR